MRYNNVRKDGSTHEYLEIGNYYTDQSRGDMYTTMTSRYDSSDGRQCDIHGYINYANSSANEGYWCLSVHNKDNNTTGNMSLRTGDSYIIGRTTSKGEVNLSMSNTDTAKIYMNGASGNVQCISLTQTSSKKYKKNIESLTDEEAKKILNLRPVTYDFKDEECGKDMRGFIAEEVDEVIPELVKHTNMDNKDELSLDYTMMIPYLTKMIQLQQKQINELKNEINKLKGEC